MQSILNRIYGQSKGAAAFSRLSAVLDGFTPNPSDGPKDIFTEADTLLITYGDTLLREGEAPLQTLNRFVRERFKGVFSGVHVLPFFPFSSDDGFSVTDFMAVRPDLGSWSEIRTIGRNYKLMVDLAANHVSAQSHWFQSYLADEKGFSQLAIEVDPEADLSSVTRPRSLPLVTAFEKKSGRRVLLWTTFSADQIDLNYRSLDVLEDMVRILLFYVGQGARIIRLDAIAYLWKQIGTACIHLPQTHDLVRLLRKVLDQVAPHVVLVTETNVPHLENISYFGDGSDEAQMVYNFTLPPLVLHALVTGSAGALSEWARSLSLVSPRTTFLNFTASHDGIGVRPLEGILSAVEIRKLVDRVRRNGGTVSEKQNPDGSRSPYELNITYLDALKNPSLAQDPLHVRRFLASQSVALCLAGVPAVYIHSLLGSRNWPEGVQRTGRARTINRRRLAADAIGAQLADPTTLESRIFYPYLEMVSIRTRQPAFHPGAGMQILALDDRVFAIKRHCPDQTLFALINLSADALAVALPDTPPDQLWTDLLSSRRFAAESVGLSAYQSVWLTAL